MRPLGALEAAQKAPRRTPYVTLDANPHQQGIRRLKWTRAYTGTETDTYHAMAISGGNAMVRVRITGTDLYWQRNADLSAPDFGTWPGANTWPSAAAPVAIAGRPPADGARMAIACHDVPGTGVDVRESTDGGATWALSAGGGIAFACSGLAVAYKPGTTSDLAVAGFSGMQLRFRKRTGGAWDVTTYFLPLIMSTPSTAWGVALVHDGCDWQIILCQRYLNNYGVWAVTFGDGGKVTTNTWSAVTPIALSPDAEALVFQAPSLDYVDDAFRLSFVEAFSGTESFTQTAFTHPPVGAGFRDGRWREPQTFDHDSADGLALAHTHDLATPYAAVVEYAASIRGVWSAPLTTPPAALSANLYSSAYVTQVVDGWSNNHLSVDLDNQSGIYNTGLPGGGGLAALARGNDLNIQHGYYTTAGNQVSDPGSMTIERIEWRREKPHQSRLRIYAVDGWGVLRYTRCRYPMSWNAAGSVTSLYEILGYVLARSGYQLSYKSRSGVMTGFYPSLALSPGDSLYTFVRQLLSFSPDGLFFEGGKAWLVNPLATDTSIYSYTTRPSPAAAPTAHPVNSLVVAEDSPEINQVQLVGLAGAALYHHQALDYGEVDQVGNRYFSDEDRNLIDAASASGRSGAILRGQYRSGRRAVIISPPNVGQELYDVVDVTDPSLALSASACRVASLAITFAPGVFSQRLVLEGV